MTEATERECTCFESYSEGRNTGGQPAMRRSSRSGRGVTLDVGSRLQASILSGKEVGHHGVCVYFS